MRCPHSWISRSWSCRPGTCSPNRVNSRSRRWPYPILWWERDALPGTHDALVSACRRAGFEPRLIDIPDVPGVLGKMLADGVGVSVISEFVAKASTDPASCGAR